MIDIALTALIVNSQLIYQDIDYTRCLFSTGRAVEHNVIARQFTDQGNWDQLMAVALLGNLSLALFLDKINPELARIYHFGVGLAEIILPYCFTAYAIKALGYKVNVQAVLFQHRF